MLAKRVPRAEKDRRWREYYAERRADVERQRSKEAATRVKGLDILFTMEGGRKLEFRGRKYGVPIVPWPLCIRVLDVEEAFADLRSHPAPSARDWAAVYKEVARLFKKICQPERRLVRLFWPLLPSPLRGASPLEVGEALRFFSVFLAMDNPTPEALAAARRTSPSPPSSPASSRITRSGATRRVARSRGSIS